MSEDADQKWREYIVSFLSDWSSPLTAVLGNSALLEVFLEALVQQGNDPIPVESGSFKAEITPEIAFNWMRNLRRNVRLLSRLKEETREHLNRPADDETDGSQS